MDSLPIWQSQPGECDKGEQRFRQKICPNTTLAPHLEVATQGIELGDEPRSQVQVVQWKQILLSSHVKKKSFQSPGLG